MSITESNNRINIIFHAREFGYTLSFHFRGETDASIQMYLLPPPESLFVIFHLNSVLFFRCERDEAAFFFFFG